MKEKNTNNNINENGLGNFQLTNLSSDELRKIKAIEDEINKNHKGNNISLMALNINKPMKNSNLS